MPLYIPLLAVIITNFFLTFYLLNRYSNFGRQNLLITISVFISWFFSFNVVFILPLDITSTIYNQCIIRNNITNNGTDYIGNNQTTSIISNISSPLPLSFDHHNFTQIGNNLTASNDSSQIKSNNESQQSTFICAKPWSYVPKNVLQNLWKFIYWSSQLLTWIILPIFQSYSMSGEFTVWKKIESSLKENLKYYCLFGFLFLIFLFYYATKQRLTMESLKIFCISASNTFGLFLLLILLSYGLVDIPRNFLKNYQCNHQYKLNYLYFRIGKINEEKYETNCQLEDLLDELRAYYVKISKENGYHYLMNKLQIIIDKCPESFRNELNESSIDLDLNFELNEKRLVSLNSKINKAMQTSHRTEVQYQMLIKQAIHLEEIIKELNDDENSSLKASSSLNNVSRIERWLIRNVPNVEFLLQHKHIIVYKIFFLVFGYLFALFSISIVWSEFTFSIKSIPISIFALIINLIDYNYFWIELFSMLSIAYLSCCCYYTIFKIRIFNYYYLSKHQQTDEYSLIFSGMLLCRLASPLCLNFLSLIHFDSHVSTESIEEETSFTQIMGHLDTISYISDYIFIYLPLFMSVFCVAILFKLDMKLFSYFGFGQYSLFDEISQEYLLEGEKLVKREQRKQRSSMATGSSSNVSGGGVKKTKFGKRDVNSNLNRTASREKLLPDEPTLIKDQDQEQQQQQNIVDIERNLFDDI
ncbi:G-protein coupled receptor-associated protein LMBRD2B [Dermatophagoides pteronyssinus]|uniref:G-protein coupled receptor-associated protein LMBRD2B n=1 Tax=Dermatophagoides pteronyssinus TaxID=6956 RepID=UPI003F663CA8